MKSLTKDYKDHVRKLPCLIGGQGSCDIHHLSAVGLGRRRSLPKWEDFTIIPLNRRLHSELHQIGIAQFEKKYKINLYKEALLILARWIFENGNNS